MLGLFAGGAAKGIVEGVGGILDDLFTSDEERLKAGLAKRRIQAEINIVEARHRSVFVAGWRPFIGWVCGAALAWQFLAHPLIIWIAFAFGWETVPPALPVDGLYPVLLGMLGLGGLRTIEKARGVSG